MTDTACPFAWLYQTCIAGFVGVDHYFSGRVVGTSTMTRLALHSGEHRRSSAVTTKATRGGTLDAEAIRSPSVLSRAPTHIGRTVTELAALRPNEGGLADTQEQEGSQQGETAISKSNKHPWRELTTLVFLLAQRPR